ncbi:histidine phosphatase family protein [Streptomyces corynorhini]|uniref:Histidine phosphatase family protein n=1 Tax=Streptomyces corynorhini TaxID=2282652 RepID=A0A370BH89_9ACTN|nr:histidine phosphatase family protein [Streptomyces corynorhini]RDG39624.1 histidine phosphatase family protein [Streptomyces corynorhini]
MTDTTRTTLFLARHGETVWHEENRYAGVSDIALTPRGAEQAQDLGAWAAGAGLDAIVTSPLSRARRTAAPAVLATGLAARVESDLAELGFGLAEGKTLGEMRRTHPERCAAFLRDPAAHPLPGGEDPGAAATRGTAALLREAERHPGGRVLVVAHSTLFRLVLCRLLSIPPGEYRRVFPRPLNCAVTEVRVAGGRASLMSYNVPTTRVVPG